VTDAARAQTWDPKSYEKHAGFVPALGAPVLELLAPEPGEAILDLGCGDGALTEKLAQAGAEVIGVDSSAEQVEAAKARGLDARVADCQALDFQQAFDAAFSNAALHWMKDPDAVISGVARALRPGGRFVGEFGGAGNVDRLRRARHRAVPAPGPDPDAPPPRYYPTPEADPARGEAAAFATRPSST